MSLLAADIGNSHTFVGLLDGDEVTAHWRVATDERRTACVSDKISPCVTQPRGRRC